MRATFRLRKCEVQRPPVRVRLARGVLLREARERLLTPLTHILPLTFPLKTCKKSANRCARSAASSADVSSEGFQKKKHLSELHVTAPCKMSTLNWSPSADIDSKSSPSQLDDPTLSQHLTRSLRWHSLNGVGDLNASYLSKERSIIYFATTGLSLLQNKHKTVA